MRPKLKPATSKALSDMEVLAAAIERARNMAFREALPAPPPGAFTTAQYATSGRISNQTAADQIKRLLRSGSHERILAYGPRVDGKVTPQWYYLEKK